MRALDRPGRPVVGDPYHLRRTEALLAWIQARCADLGHTRVADIADVDGDAELDLVVAHRALEREHDPRALLERLAGTVGEGGDVVVVTPNRLTASPGRTRPVAAGHAWEYTPDELRHLLRLRFTDVRVWGLFHGRRLLTIERILGTPLAPTLAVIAPPDRAIWLRAALRRARATDFPIGAGRLTDALDLIAVARA